MIFIDFSPLITPVRKVIHELRQTTSFLCMCISRNWLRARTCFASYHTTLQVAGLKCVEVYPKFDLLARFNRLQTSDLGLASLCNFCGGAGMLCQFLVYFNDSAGRFYSFGQHVIVQLLFTYFQNILERFANVRFSAPLATPSVSNRPKVWWGAVERPVN